MDAGWSTRSPDGRYELRTQVSTGRMSHEMFTPSIVATESGEELLGFANSNWSLDEHQWKGDTIVRMVMRKYPGNHRPVDLDFTVDLVAMTATLTNGETAPLERLEALLDRNLEWI
jgi:hypothetical protein